MTDMTAPMAMAPKARSKSRPTWAAPVTARVPVASAIGAVVASGVAAAVKVSVREAVATPPGVMATCWPLPTPATETVSVVPSITSMTVQVDPAGMPSKLRGTGRPGSPAE